MADLATIAAVATIGSAVVGAGASVYSGYQSMLANEAAAKQEILAGKNEFAASQRDADERRLEAKLVASRAQAIAAASGGGGADQPTISKILTDIGERADFGVKSIMYGGAQRRDDYFNSASSRRVTGQSNFIGGLLRGLGSLAGGVGDWAEQTP